MVKSIAMTKTSEVKGFEVGDTVVYPSHGVGRITAEEVQIIAGIEMGLYVISFSKDKMILRVPKARAFKTGLRHLTSTTEFKEAIIALQAQSKSNKGMWSKRAQEYEQKINSGNVISIAEVLRDLHRNVDDPDRSYSERVIYESALERLTNEYAASMQVEKQDASSQIIEILDYNKI